MQFYDGTPEVELRVQLGGTTLNDPKEVYVDANECSLVVGVKSSGSLKILMETNQLYGRIKPGETIWYLDDDQMVITLKKHDAELKWPDIVESWESLNVGVVQLLKGTTIFLVGDSTEINEKVARELAVGLGYTPLDTKGLLEAYAKKNIESCEYNLNHTVVLIPEQEDRFTVCGDLLTDLIFDHEVHCSCSTLFYI